MRLPPREVRRSIAEPILERLSVYLNRLIQRHFQRRAPVTHNRHEVESRQARLSNQTTSFGPNPEGPPMTEVAARRAQSETGDPLLLTPGPLTTSKSVKQAMLHD